jgi:dihydroorotase (multifunctional complex type)
LAVDLIIKNGRIFSSAGFYEGAIIVNSGKIEAFTKSSYLPNADKVLDARGKLVLPGMVDMHVHFRDPGFTDREDFETGTRSAAAGGVTTVADMPNTEPSVTSVKALEGKLKVIQNKALVDYALIGGAGELSSDTLRAIAENGVAGFKTFMIARFKELAASDGQMLENFKTISTIGLPCLVHAENEDIVSHWRKKAIAQGRIDPLAHSEFRPAVAENEATIRTILLAAETGVHLHICHMSTKGASALLQWGKNNGVNVSGETSTNYLLLNADIMKKVGPYAKIDPPLRGIDDQTSLWQAVNKGVIDVLASDHAPYPIEDKEVGWKNIFEAPSGGIGVETSLPLMLDAMNNGKIKLERLVEIFSTNPSKILGLYPKKGTLALGSDADIVIVDLKSEYKINQSELHAKQKFSVFDGYEGRGIPITTIIRGKIVMDENVVLGEPGYGMFMRPI